MEAITSTGDNNIDKERGGQYDTSMAAFLLNLFDSAASVSSTVWKFYL